MAQHHVCLSTAFQPSHGLPVFAAQCFPKGTMTYLYLLSDLCVMFLLTNDNDDSDDDNREHLHNAKHFSNINSFNLQEHPLG